MKKIFSIFSFFLFLTGFSQDNKNLKLWYTEPSGKTWENALPIGNGFLGAMVYGNVENEMIQLNENTVWSGGPNENNNPDALASLPEIRKMIFEGKHKDAEKLANETFITKKSHGQMFQPVGNLNLNFAGHEKFANYRRELDIEKAIAKISTGKEASSDPVEEKPSSFSKWPFWKIQTRPPKAADKESTLRIMAFKGIRTLPSMKRRSTKVESPITKPAGNR